MLQIIGSLLVCLLPSEPAVGSVTWTDVARQLLITQMPQTIGIVLFEIGDTTEAANVDEAQTMSDEPSPAEDEAQDDDIAVSTPAGKEPEQLEAIEESRPDDLDEFAEASSRTEKGVDTDELGELGSVLSDDGEIDWTTPAD